MTSHLAFLTESLLHITLSLIMSDNNQLQLSYQLITNAGTPQLSTGGNGGQIFETVLLRYCLGPKLGQIHRGHGQLLLL